MTAIRANDFSTEVRAMRFGEAMGEGEGAVLGTDGQVGLTIQIEGGTAVTLVMGHREASRLGGELVGASIRASVIGMTAAGERS